MAPGFSRFLRCARIDVRPRMTDMEGGTMEPNTPRNMTADRGRDVYSATIAEVSSASDEEIRSLIDGTITGEANSRDAQTVREASREYDQLIRDIQAGITPLLKGIALSVAPISDVLGAAADNAARIAMRGAPVHSIVNAANITLIAAGRSPVEIQRALVSRLLDASASARNGATAPLAELLQSLVADSIQAPLVDRVRAVREAWASLALEGLQPDSRDDEASQEYIDGKVTASELVARLKAEYGAQ